MKLRPYQEEAVRAVEAAWEKGIQRPLIAMATGSGKTVVAIELIRRQTSKNGNTAMILAHRDELINQAVEKIELCWPEAAMEIGVIKAERNEFGRRISVASVQSLSRQNRLARAVAQHLLVTDECFRYRTEVTLEDGRRIPIGQIVNQRLECNVLSVNPETGEVEAKPVTRYFKHLPRHPIVRVAIENRRQAVVCTANHTFYTPIGKVRADELETGDLVYVRSFVGKRYSIPPMLGAIQKQVFLGCVLGDSSLRKNARSEKARLSFVHGEKQLDYLEYKAEVFRDFITQNVRSFRSGYADTRIFAVTTTSSVELYEWWREIYTPTKHISLETAGQLTPISLAFFVMDDGSLSRNAGGTYFYRLSTEDFDQESCLNLARAFKEKWDIDVCVRQTHKKGKSYWVIRVYGENVRRLSSLIARYIYPTLDYKLLPEHRGQFTRLSGDPVPVNIARVKSVLPARLYPKESPYVYNITVADNHNYFANGILVGNCHHSPADSYLRIYERLFELNPEMYHLGVTATPRRADNVALGKVFDEVVFSLSIKDLIRQGFLCSLKAKAIRTNIDLDGVRTVAGEFNQKQLASVVDVENRNELIVDSYVEHGDGRKALCFTVSVDHAHRLAEMFREKGISAEALSGETPLEERREILRRFSVGEIQVVTNCAVLTEGFDEPSIECIILTRPTKSQTLYIQMVGRGTRIFPKKEDCLILDFVDSTTRHRLAQLHDIFDGEEKKEEEKRTEEPGEGRMDYFIGRGEGITAEDVSLFDESNHRWMRLDNGDFVCGLGGQRSIQIIYQSGGWWSLMVEERNVVPLTPFPCDLEWALTLADEKAQALGEPALIEKEREWFELDASAKQVARLKEWKERGWVDPWLVQSHYIEAGNRMTRGVASALMTYTVGRWSIDKWLKTHAARRVA